MLSRFFNLNSKTYISLITWLGLFSFPLAGQEITRLDRVPLVNEMFTSNNNGWLGIGVEDEQGSAFITNEGYCEIQTSQKSAMVIANEWELDENRDFEITCEVSIVHTKAGAENNLISLSWGCSFETLHQFSMGIAPAGLSTVRTISSNITEIVPAKNISLEPDSRNTISIIKMDDAYSFYANNQRIGTAPFQPFFGNGIIFTVGSGLKVHLHYLQINYLTPKMNIHRLPRLALDPPFNEQEKVETEDEQYVVSGMVMDEDGIASVKVNGNQIKPNNGKFEYRAALINGNNLIKIEVTDNSGQKQTKYLEIVRKEAAEKLMVGQKRLALVIGNSKYRHAAPLKNTIKDAADMATLLSGLGFDVLHHENLDYRNFVDAIRKFGNSIHQYDVTLVFYAGHGIQVDGENYLIPVDAKLNNKHDVGFETIEADKLISIMAETDDNNLNLLILDACRNNPFRSWERGGPEGLAGMQPPSGVLVAYSTSPGAYASDGLGDNGLYTKELMKQLQISQRIEDVFINTRIAVERRSGGTQSPWELARLRGKYYLK
jgi:hypothetical protein